MKKVFIMSILFLILLLTGCKNVESVELTPVEILTQSAEEIHQAIKEKMSWDIQNYHISDYYIETDEKAPLKISTVNDIVFDDLYNTLDSEGHLGDGHFFLSWLPAWSEDLSFRNMVVDPASETDENNNSKNFYCIFENEQSVKLYIFFYETDGVWQSCGYYINPVSEKYENPATDWSPCIQQIDK